MTTKDYRPKLSPENQARIDNAPANPTTTRAIRFRKLSGTLHIVKTKTTLVEGTFGPTHLEPGDGYIIVCGGKILISRAQIAELEKE